jgi:hydroxymethylglutaryl-CoA lyase
MLEAMGLATGVDLPGLIATREILRSALPSEELYGYTALAGLPLGFQPASH